MVQKTLTVANVRPYGPISARTLKVLRNGLCSVVLLSALSIWPFQVAAQQATEGTVYFLADTSQTPRWAQQDVPYLQAALKQLAPGLQVELLSAEGDPKVQADQLNNAITLGAKAIVLVTADENAAGGMLAAAQRASVPVILYDHDGKGGPAAARVLFDFEETGFLQGSVAAEDLSKRPGEQKLGRIFALHGLSVTEDFARGQDRALKPLYDSGKIKLVCDDWTTGVTIAEAQRLAEQCITRNGNEVDAFITLNDAWIVGMIAAVQSAGLKPGDVELFGGQDADLGGLQNMIRGYQAATIYKPFKQQAEAAAKITASLVSTGQLPSDLTFERENNGAVEIPVLKLTPVVIRPNEIRQIVNDGVYSWEEICAGDVATSEICKAR